MAGKMLALVASMVVGSAGWWLGEKIGLFSAFTLSAVGTGLGIYLGRRLAIHWDLP
jgi:hypothetical protein